MNSYLLLDAARMGEYLEDLKAIAPDHSSLYLSKPEDLLQSVAPYLFPLGTNKQLENYYFNKGWGDSWGIMIHAASDLKNLLRHFRNFLTVKTEEGEELFFRFYDPRVLRVFLPTCDSKQLKDFFGPVDTFTMEDEDADYALQFTFVAGLLKTKKVSKEALGKAQERENEDIASKPPNPETQHVTPKKQSSKWNMLDW